MFVFNTNQVSLEFSMCQIGPFILNLYANSVFMDQSDTNGLLVAFWNVWHNIATYVHRSTPEVLALLCNFACTYKSFPSSTPTPDSLPSGNYPLSLNVYEINILGFTHEGNNPVLSVPVSFHVSPVPLVAARRGFHSFSFCCCLWDE